ncbi:hypothetical protein IG631_15943 [Alternaria alternata]|nr:hypothetical protein IG631_15943 [Alternaria alternata]
MQSVTQIYGFLHLAQHSQICLVTLQDVGEAESGIPRFSTSPGLQSRIVQLNVLHDAEISVLGVQSSPSTTR